MKETVQFDVVVVGGGMSGICAAIASARGGARTALIQNRPVLGGNASSEIRMHICGADNHMQRENARETGILEEILLENKRRNPEMVYPIFDTVLWEKVRFQENLTLYLNTHMVQVRTEEDRITEIEAVQMTNEKAYVFRAAYFVDATGDGTLGALAGAEYRIGREASSEFGESFAPETEDSCTMGNSLMFQARDMGKPVAFEKPSWANTYTEEQLRFRDHEEITSGYWWIELGGGQLSTISDAEMLRDELLKAVYGVWDHIKNGGGHHAEQMELEWVGFLPGKRESRRLIGDYILTQADCSNAVAFEDTVAYGGWPMDIHTVEGFLNETDNPTVWNQINDIYSIPYRCLYSRNIENLFLGGRAISCSHVAFSSTRVMGTCAVVGQAVGTAAAMAVQKSISPRMVGAHIRELQQRLLRDDCYLPGIRNEDAADIARLAKADGSGYVPGCGPEEVLNGWGRSVGAHANCFRADLKQDPRIRLTWPEAHCINEVQLLFDSNLSREIMMSLSDTVRARQVQGPPPELIRRYALIFRNQGTVVRELVLESNGQRKQTIPVEPVAADQIEVQLLETYGAETAAVYEIRVYEA